MWQKVTNWLDDGWSLGANRQSETIIQVVAWSTLLPFRVTTQKAAQFSPLKHSSPPTEAANFIWEILPVVPPPNSSAGNKGALLCSSSRGLRNFLPPANRRTLLLVLQSAFTNLLPILYSVAKLASSQEEKKAAFCLHFPFTIHTHAHRR